MKIKATCACCGRSEEYELSTAEEYNLEAYQKFGRGLGTLQDLFPTVPAWIRSGAIDKFSGGFCVCPECGMEDDE